MDELTKAEAVLNAEAIACLPTSKQVQAMGSQVIRESWIKIQSYREHSDLFLCLCQMLNRMQEYTDGTESIDELQEMVGISDEQYKEILRKQSVMRALPEQVFKDPKIMIDRACIDIGINEELSSSEYFPSLSLVSIITKETTADIVKRVVNRFQRSPSCTVGLKCFGFDVEYVDEELTCISVTNRQETIVFTASSLEDRDDGCALMTLRSLFNSSNICAFGWGVANDRKFLKRLGIDTTYVLELQHLCYLRGIKVTSLDTTFNTVLQHNAMINDHKPTTVLESLALCAIDSWKTYILGLSIPSIELSSLISDTLDFDFTASDGTSKVVKQTDLFRAIELRDEERRMKHKKEELWTKHRKTKAAKDPIAVHYSGIEEGDNEKKIAQVLLIAEELGIAPRGTDGGINVPCVSEFSKILLPGNALIMLNQLKMTGVIHSDRDTEVSAQNSVGFVVTGSAANIAVTSSVHTRKKNARIDFTIRCLLALAVTGQIANAWLVKDVYDSEWEEVQSSITVAALTQTDDPEEQREFDEVRVNAQNELTTRLEVTRADVAERMNAEPKWDRTPWDDDGPMTEEQRREHNYLNNEPWCKSNAPDESTPSGQTNEEEETEYLGATDIGYTSCSEDDDDRGMDDNPFFHFGQ